MQNISNDIIQFYQLLEKLEEKNNGVKYLCNCHGRMKWPKRGVYFFFDDTTGKTMNRKRVVRVGTHAITEGSKSTLWQRLRQHKGHKNLGGNHRGSIFRSLVGSSIINTIQINNPGFSIPTWADDKHKDKATEKEIEIRVSNYIGRLPFIVLDIDDTASPQSLRDYIEKNSISLLSVYNKSIKQIELENWLGFYSNSESVQTSRLWNQKHTEKSIWDSDFLNRLSMQIDKMEYING